MHNIYYEILSSLSLQICKNDKGGHWFASKSPKLKQWKALEL